MDSDEIGRRRSPNFSKEEKICLLHLVKVFEKYIEEKKNDLASNRLKNKAWTKVRIEFNKKVDKINGSPRDTLCLRTKYTDIKKTFNKALREQGKSLDDYRSNLVDHLIEFETTEVVYPQAPLEIKKEPLDIDDSGLNKSEEELDPPDLDTTAKEKSNNRRLANYSLKETLTLISLVKKYKHIVLDRRTEGSYSKKKIEQWEIIANEFHAELPMAPRRSGPKLREKLNDMKKRFKKKLQLPPEKTKHDCEFVLLKSALGDYSNEVDLGDIDDLASSSQCGDGDMSLQDGDEIKEEIIDDYDEGKEEIHSKEGLAVETLSAIDQYYFDKNRREEEEHQLQVELLKVKIQREKMEMERLSLDQKSRSLIP